MYKLHLQREPHEATLGKKMVKEERERERKGKEVKKAKRRMRASRDPLGFVTKN